MPRIFSCRPGCACRRAAPWRTSRSTRLDRSRQQRCSPAQAARAGGRVPVEYHLPVSGGVFACFKVASRAAKSTRWTYQAGFATMGSRVRSSPGPPTNPLILQPIASRPARPNCLGSDHVETRGTCESAGLQTMAVGRNQADFCPQSARGSFLRETRMCDLKHKAALSVPLCFKMLSRTQFLRGFAVDTHYDYSMLVQGFVPVVCKNAGMVTRTCTGTTRRPTPAGSTRSKSG